MMRGKVAKVAVLLATHNGINWLAEQVTSILGQQDVDVRLIVSDDASTDGTSQWLKILAQEDNRVVLLPCGSGYGSAGRNFYRLVLEADTSDCDYVAFADQDDIWLKNKLKSQIRLSVQHGADGVSSNVVAFWRDGSRGLIDKAEPLRRLDFIFESAGPGCTFLLSPWLIGQVRRVLSDANSEARQIELHDWLVYAVCRALGRKWHIDSVPTMLLV
jgi:rhamnosyltransferase